MNNIQIYTPETVAIKREEIKSDHRKGSDGRDTSIGLTNLADSCIHTVITDLNLEGVVIAAVGGYGRCQLSPYSDLDLITIYDENAESNETKVSDMVRSLWDLGWSLSHTYLTLDEVKSKADTDLNFFSSLLDLRVIHSDDKFGDRLNRTLSADILPTGLENLINAKLEETTRRHERFGSTSRVLEPNIKESAGGLRDIHSLIWINMNMKLLIPFEDNTVYSRVDSYLNLISEKENWHPGLTKRLIDANDLILKIRHEIHYLRKEKNDFLTFDIRDDVAKNLIMNKNGENVSSFLRNYYRSVRNISRALQLSEELLGGTVLKLSRTNIEAKMLQPGIYSDGSRLYVDATLGEKVDYNLTNIIELFRYSKENNYRLSSLLLYQIDKHYLDFELSSKDRKKIGKLFFDIFDDPANLAQTLRQLFETGILKIIIPELDDMYCHAPKSRYHYYTTDEHTMRALEVIEKLDSSEGIGELQEVLRDLENKNELMLALLFHDIAKPRETTEGEHVAAGAEDARRILKNLGYGGNIDLIERLISNHLVMEQTAFRRDISLLETIELFCLKIKDVETLNCLYLLTYADLYAVNPTVWSEWKRSLLSNLYRNALDYLNGYFKKDIKIENANLVNDLRKKHSEEKVKSTLAMLPISYQHEFDSRQISDHISDAENLKTEIVSVKCRSYFNFSEVTIIAGDRKYLMSDICAVFAVNNVSIFEAKIYTRTDGIAIDSFHVVSLKERKPLSPETIKELNNDLVKILKNEIEIKDLFERHKRRWKWTYKSALEIPIRIEFDESKDFSIIDITGSDMFGLLHSITRALSKCNVVIYSAKISTKEDGLIDSFYVLDNLKKKIGININEEDVKNSIINEAKSSLFRATAQV
ncbi:HD domain-containing protein [Candidatus Marinimicrobia bacterium MT.SAG.2]|nr:HD domain-containing protein [Candidatus Marinimicrobia bacterium MT.SAG.2]